MEPVLSVEGLTTHFVSEGRTVSAVENVSFELFPGEVLGLVGESGSGKSATALSLLRLVPSPPGRIVSGRVMYGGRDLLALSEREMRQLRGREIAMIFQEPRTAMNPAFRIGEQMVEVIRRHKNDGRRAAREQAAALLEQVRIADPPRILHAYPHELSGGMLQRAMIAMQLSSDPAVLIADEPTTALDVTIQAQILELLSDLRRERNLAILLITHDMGVVAQACDRVAVMYAGRIAETALARSLFRRQFHPYTRGLLASIPRLDVRRDELPIIRGGVADLSNPPPGCRFVARCDFACTACEERPPELRLVADGHRVACVVESAQRATG